MPPSISILAFFGIILALLLVGGLAQLRPQDYDLFKIVVIIALPLWLPFALVIALCGWLAGEDIRFRWDDIDW